MTVGQMKEFIKDLDDNLEILFKTPGGKQTEGHWEPLDSINIKVEPKQPE